MKSLALSTPLLLLMVGRPGAGKSFFARQFSMTFGAPVVSHDQLRATLFHQATFSADEQTIIDQVADLQLTELLKTKRTIIIDGGCNAKAARQQLARLARDHDYNTLIIWVQTDEATCLSRSTKRNSRRTDDQHKVSLTPEQYEIQAKHFSQPMGEDFIVISGKHTYATQARTVLKRLAEPHQEQATAAHEANNQSLTHPDKRTGRSIFIR